LLGKNFLNLASSNLIGWLCRLGVGVHSLFYSYLDVGQTVVSCLSGRFLESTAKVKQTCLVMQDQQKASMLADSARALWQRSAMPN